MSTRIPALLEPYLTLPPESSLVLVTSVLGARANWLVLRFLCSFLRPAAAADGEEEEDTGVVLVSFLRDGAFWRDGAAKLGLDWEALSRTGRLVFVDGLTALATGQVEGAVGKGTRVLKSVKLDHVKAEIEAALADLKPTRRILIVDQPDALLAISDDITSLALQNTLLSLRESAHATVLALAADAPLLHAQATALEREHAALVLGQAHAADTLLALRALDTGSARDVSGVVRVTSGGDGGGGREYLFFVGGDGVVKVFERGA